MGQIDVTDAWLYKYMSIVDEAIINEIEKNVDYDYAFSDEFNRKMERTIRKEKFIPFWNSVSKFGKSVAIFALVIVTSLFAVTMSVEAYRIQFFETVKTIWEDSFFYTYFTEEKDIGFQKREFEYLVVRGMKVIIFGIRKCMYFLYLFIQIQNWLSSY